MIPMLMDNLRLRDPEINSATLTFINAIINGISDTETRVTVRNEFIKMNIKDYLKVRKWCRLASFELCCFFFSKAESLK
jgi:hypothetical protein